jgi:hypothetical protein
MAKVDLKGKIVIVLVVELGLAFSGMQYSVGQEQIAQAVKIQGSFDVNDTKPSYVAGNIYYYLKNVTITPSIFPTDIRDTYDPRPSINIDPNSVSMRWNLDIHTTPQDVNKSSANIYIPITHIRNNTQSVIIDGYGGSSNIGDKTFNNLTAKINVNKVTNYGEFEVSDR